MNTTTATAKIRRILKANAFEKFNGEYGFKIHTEKNDSHQVSVINYHFGDTNEVAETLAQAGFEVSAPNKFATLIYLTNN
jgi:hypothetical protein